MDNKFPRGIEVGTAGLIRRSDGKLLLVKSYKWSNKWCLPGGHIELGESIKDATIREMKEETNLDTTYITQLLSGELINCKDFYRPAHLIHFANFLTTAQHEPKLDNDELSDYQWLTPDEALKLPLAETVETTIRKYIDYTRNTSSI